MTDSHYDAIVVGSGFGGSVTAYRLAEAGKRVLSSSAAAPIPPGSFTRSPYQAPARASGIPDRGLTGMYHYWSFKGIDALVSAGLGGGSLIYANVFLRKDERWFVDEDVNDGGYESWPVTRADLDPHYDRVEKMIGLQRYPFEHEPYASTPKTIAFKDAAERNGLEWFLPQLAVTFANEGRPPVPGEKIVEKIRNLHGRDRVTCQLCGECDVGCNFGAKNTLDYNYLTHAQHHGAEIRTLCDVRTLAAARRRRLRRSATGRSTTDTAQPSTNGRPAPRTDSRATTSCSARARWAPRTCCCATAAPSRASAASSAPASAATATCSRWPSTAARPSSGGGCRRGSSIPATARSSPAPRGCPTRSTAARAAASTCRTPATRSTWRGSCTCSPRRRRCGTGARSGCYLVKNWLQGSPDTDVTGHIADLLESAELSAGGLPLLGMGRDVPDGRMFLKHGRLDVDWKRAESDAYFERLRTTRRATSRTRSAAVRRQPDLVPQARDHRPPARRCADGPPAGEGVVDPYGNVFGYPGPAHRRRLGDARSRPARTRASRSPRWPTASPTGSSSPPRAAEAAAT